jgi:hypothetical protein
MKFDIFGGLATQGFGGATTCSVSLRRKQVNRFQVQWTDRNVGPFGIFGQIGSRHPNPPLLGRHGPKPKKVRKTLLGQWERVAGRPEKT